MSGTINSLLEVSIEFENSHLVFPTIIMYLLGIVLVVILLTNYKTLFAKLKGEQGGFRFFAPDADKFRLFSTLTLTTIYFYTMDIVGQQFPNTGYGFLFTSVVFVFLLSLLYAHRWNSKTLLAITLNAVIAPLCAWYVLGQLFSITLP